MNTKHTPGPWFADGRIIAMGTTRIAEIHDQTCIGSIELGLPYEANARLIAQAPALYSFMRLTQQLCTLDVTDFGQRIQVVALQGTLAGMAKHLTKQIEGTP